MLESAPPNPVVICIPTFKRPKMLGRLLDAIAALVANRFGEDE